jgi:hypothetical protein
MRKLNDVRGLVDGALEAILAEVHWYDDTVYSVHGHGLSAHSRRRDAMSCIAAVGVAGQRQVVALAIHPALDGTDADPRIEPAVESQKGRGRILWPHLQPEETEVSEHETGTIGHGSLVRSREESRAKQVVIGHVGRDPALERGAARARKLHPVAALGALVHVAGQLTTAPMRGHESLKVLEHHSGAVAGMAISAIRAVRILAGS